MLGHHEIRDLLGPHVMGDLDPEEERAVVTHLRDCAACREEAGSLSTTHERMVELAEASEAPPPHLKNRALTDLPRSGFRRTLSVWASVAAAALIVAIGLAYGPSLLGDQEVAAATLEPMGEAPNAGAEVNVRGSGENLEVNVDAWGLPKCEEGEYYQLWFVKENGKHVSAGTFTVGESGDTEIHLTAPRFATSYPRIGVTVERDSDPRPSGEMMMGGELREK